LDRNKVANTLKSLRKSKGETQEETAKAIGVCGSAYAAYETGTRIPRDDVKERIAGHFNRSVAFIFFK
jgi:putative transcriptional regulator